MPAAIAIGMPGLPPPEPTSTTVPGASRTTRSSAVSASATWSSHAAAGSRTEVTETGSATSRSR